MLGGGTRRLLLRKCLQAFKADGEELTALLWGLGLPKWGDCCDAVHGCHGGQGIPAFILCDVLMTCASMPLINRACCDDLRSCLPLLLPLLPTLDFLGLAMVGLPAL